MLATIKDWDLRVLNRINDHYHTRFLDFMMPKVSFLGNYGYIWIFISLILFFNQETRRVAVQTIFGLILTTTIGEGIIKHIARRKRPFFYFKHLQLSVPAPITYSFPSGHTASSFSSLLILGGLNVWMFIFCLILAVAIGFSRMYLKVHYPSDVLCGFILGIICGSLVLYIMPV